MEIINFRINWFAESLTVRPSKQKSSNNSQKQVYLMNLNLNQYSFYNC